MKKEPKKTIKIKNDNNEKPKILKPKLIGK